MNTETIIAIITIVITIIGLFRKLVVTFISYKNYSIQSLKLKRLKNSKKSVSTKYKKFYQRLIDAEVFYHNFKFVASPKLIKLLEAANKKNNLTGYQIKKGNYRFSISEKDKLKFKIDLSDILFFYYSIICTIFMFLVFIISIIVFIFAPKSSILLTKNLIVTIASLVILAFFVKNILDYVILKRINKKIEKMIT